VGLFSDILAGRSLDAVLGRVRQRLTAGDFEEAARQVEKGLERYPDAEPLRELRHVVRRAQASKGLTALKEQVARNDDPLAHEQLIALYQDVGMPAEASRAAEAYALAHPDRDTPHLMLGEMALQRFFEDLQARDAMGAREQLVRAARLNSQALKPRLLLAELYFCIGADASLGVAVDALARIDPDDPVILPVIEAARAVRRHDARENLEALVAQVEVDGALKREPTAWPLRTRRNRDQRVKEERAQAAARRLVESSDAEEVVVVRRTGALVAHSGGDVGHWTSEDGGETHPEQGVPGIAAAVARTLGRQVRELDLGAFRRCTIQGPFGSLVVGEVGGVVAAVKHRPGHEPHRVWDRLVVALEGGRR
jgi:hypothetical protein